MPTTDEDPPSPPTVLPYGSPSGPRDPWQNDGCRPVAEFVLGMLAPFPFGAFAMAVVTEAIGLVSYRTKDIVFLTVMFAAPLALAVLYPRARLFAGGWAVAAAVTLLLLYSVCGSLFRPFL